MSRSIARFVAGMALLAIPAFAEAQAVCIGSPSCSLNPTVSLTIPKIVRFRISSSTVTLNAPAWATDSLAGQSVATTFTGLNIKANHSWTINISSADANWTYTGTESGERARETLEFDPNCGGAFAALSATPTMVLSGARANGATPNLCLRTNFPADYTSLANRPGSYTLSVTLTLAAD